MKNKMTKELAIDIIGALDRLEVTDLNPFDEISEKVDDEDISNALDLAIECLKMANI